MGEEFNGRVLNPSGVEIDLPFMKFVAGKICR